MDATRFDTLTRLLTRTPTRRGLGRTVAGLALGGTLISAWRDETAAKNKCGPCKKKKHGKCKKKLSDGTTCSGGTCQNGSCQAGKSLRQLCNPATESCGSGLQCSTPTTRHSCSSSVQGVSTWCCVPPGGRCTECDCCGNNYCEFNNQNVPSCVPNPEGP